MLNRVLTYVWFRRTDRRTDATIRMDEMMTLMDGIARPPGYLQEIWRPYHPM
jgi:hypothetical protein